MASRQMWAAALVPLVPLVLATLVLGILRFSPSPAERKYGEMIHETRSAFSLIRVRERGMVRSLLFVDEAGREACQSSVDLADPATMRLAYTETLLAATRHRLPGGRVLVVGLGGGGMVRCLETISPETAVEAVEIDPVVVRLAREYFGVVESERVKVYVGDAFDFFDGSRGLYDAIYLDAFLRAPESSGLGEKTARLKTAAFLEAMRAHLAPGGAAAFNLIRADPRTEGDLAVIRSVFGTVELREVPGTGNLVAVAVRGDRQALRATPSGGSSELIRARQFWRSGMEKGLVTMSFIPTAKQRSRSSSKTIPVMATMGAVAFGWSRARIAVVAS